MANLMDTLSKEQPAGRGLSLLTQTDVKQITQARNAGYSWDQIHKALGKYNTASALYQAYYRDVEKEGGEG